MTDNLPATTSAVPALAQSYPVQEGESPVRYVARLMELLPEPSGDTLNKIAAQILEAETMFDENELWEATGSAKLIGRRFRFDRISAQPSDFEESPLPYFLVVEAVDVDSGEQVVITTGSLNICTSLVKAHLLGNLPAIAEIMGPRRKPRSGHIPLHLRWQMKVSAAE